MERPDGSHWKRRRQEEMIVSDKIKGLVSNILYIAFVLLFSFLIVRYVGQRTEVIGSSMVPTLEDGDQLITDKISYRFREPERFDIIVFPHQPMNEFYIKRIIGLPGETVEIEEDGTIYINGEVLPEEYGYGETTPQELTGEVVLGDDEYFVLGDNREISLDSRYAEVGNIPRSIIIGRAWLRLYPFSEFGLLTGK
ncbi:MAG: signal peptidase I [Lachnospiraceae bacterium]|jgi:signal peptidase I|nr:signal peptidase I [Lachnospiraceae bacterium]